MSLHLMTPEEIDASVIQGLIDLPAREGQRLEFKSALPGGSNTDKREFLADVSAFANAIGGDLVYGIAESSGEATSIEPLGGDVDAEVLRLENLIRDGVDPRIPGVRLKPIPVDGGHVILLRVPRSWGGPHVVTLGGSFRFFTRTSAGKHPIDVRELRQLFAMSESVERRIRAFRADRVAQVEARAEGIRLGEGAALLVHILPLVPSSVPDVPNLTNKALELGPITSHGFDWRHNLDGFSVFWAPNSDEVLSYTQVFRDGGIEMADTYLLSKEQIPARHLEDKIIGGVDRAIQVQQSLGVSPPLVVLISMTGVRGRPIHAGNSVLSMGTHEIDRSTLLLPETIVRELPFDAASELKLAFDAFWNAGGWPRSLSYDEEGKRLVH